MSCGSSQLPRLMVPCLQQAPTPKHPYPACFNPTESICLWTIGLGSARIFWRIGWRLGVRIQCDY